MPFLVEPVLYTKQRIKSPGQGHITVPSIQSLTLFHLENGPLNATKPVFWVSNKARLKPVSPATETS